MAYSTRSIVDRVVVRDSPYDHMPPRWSGWRSAVDQGHEPSALGFACQQAALNRFAARYRVADAFDGVRLPGFGRETVDGYSALFGLFLAWTAFEQYLKAIPCTQKDCLPWFRKLAPDRTVDRIRQLDSGNRLYHLVISKSKPHVAGELRKYLDRQPFNFTYLASSVRHVFAHGMLTPNANGADPVAVGRICDLLSNAHLDAVAGDFEDRMLRFRRTLKTAK